MPQKLSYNAILATLAALSATSLVACGGETTPEPETPVAAKEVPAAESSEPAPAAEASEPAAGEAATAEAPAGEAAPAEPAATSAPAATPAAKPAAKKKAGGAKASCGAGTCG